MHHESCASSFAIQKLSNTVVGNEMIQESIQLVLFYFYTNLAGVLSKEKKKKATTTAQQQKKLSSNISLNQFASIIIYIHS